MGSRVRGSDGGGADWGRTTGEMQCKRAVAPPDEEGTATARVLYA